MVSSDSCRFVSSQTGTGATQKAGPRRVHHLREHYLEEIGTNKRAIDLNIPEKARLVETIAKPKERLEEAIRLAFKNQPNRLLRMSAREIRVSLYEPMGQNVDLDRLDLLSGYQFFKRELVSAFKKLNII